jgi:hyperosmotically inducible periplasmic protein
MMLSEEAVRRVSMLKSFVLIGVLLCFSAAAPAADAHNKSHHAKKVVTDESITSAVKTRLAKDKIGRANSIDVDTKDGIVTLTGSVPRATDKTHVGNVVLDVKGVKRIANNLTISGDATGTSGKGDVHVPVPDKGDVKAVGGKIEDGTITTEVKTRLMKDRVARGTHIDVSTDDGVVTIGGAVPTEADRERIGRLVEHTTGVKRVVNNLTVR